MKKSIDIYKTAKKEIRKINFTCNNCNNRNYEVEEEFLSVTITDTEYYREDWKHLKENSMEEKVTYIEGKSGKNIEITSSMCEYCQESQTNISVFNSFDDEPDYFYYQESHGNVGDFNFIDMERDIKNKYAKISINFNEFSYEYFKNKIDEEVYKSLKAAYLNLSISKESSLFLIRRTLEIIIFFNFNNCYNDKNLNKAINDVLDNDKKLLKLKEKIIESVIEDDNEKILIKNINSLFNGQGLKVYMKDKRDDIIKIIGSNKKKINKIKEVDDTFKDMLFYLNVKDIEIFHEFKVIGNSAVHNIQLTKEEEESVVNVYKRLEEFILNVYKIDHPKIHLIKEENKINHDKTLFANNYNDFVFIIECVKKIKNNKNYIINNDFFKEVQNEINNAETHMMFSSKDNPYPTSYKKLYTEIIGLDFTINDLKNTVNSISDIKKGGDIITFKEYIKKITSELDKKMFDENMPF